MSSVMLFLCIVGDTDEDEETKVDVVINIRELDEVLIKDVGNKIAASDK